MSSLRAVVTLAGTLVLASVLMYERGMATLLIGDTFVSLYIAAGVIGAFSGFAMAEHASTQSTLVFGVVPSAAFTYGYCGPATLAVVMSGKVMEFAFVYLSFFAAYVLTCWLLRSMEDAARAARAQNPRFRD